MQVRMRLVEGVGNLGAALIVGGNFNGVPSVSHIMKCGV